MGLQWFFRIATPDQVVAPKAPPVCGLRQVKTGPHHAHLEDLRDVAGRRFGISAITGIPTVGSADGFLMNFFGEVLS